MQAIVLDAPHQATLQTVAEPPVQTGDVIVRVERCGICGTDQHLYDGDYALTRYPVIPGHELAGIVEDIGANVTAVKPGQRVVIEPNIHCEHCHYCHIQRGNHCLNLEVIGVNRAGGFAQFVVAPERNVYPADGLTAEQAAFVEPLSCVVHGLRRLRLERNDVYQLHTVDRRVPIAESVGALAQLQREGLIKMIGLSNVSVDQLRRAQTVARIVSVQNQFNRGLLTSENVLDACEAEGIAFFPWNPLGEGLRGPAYEIPWLLDRSPVMLPIPGTSTVAHLEENMSAVAG